MPRFAVDPDDLGDAAASTASEGPALELAHRLVGTAVDEAVAACGPVGGALAAAVGAYGHVEMAVAVALGEAAATLSAGLASAGVEYAWADSAVRP